MAFAKKEDSGLFRTTLELVKYTGRLGHDVALKDPQGQIMFGSDRGTPDVYTIHSQLDPATYFDSKPKVMWMHGEPLSSFGNGISLRAIIDLAAKVDCFICMRREEWPLWSSVKRTYVVPKGIDLELFTPLEGISKLSGAPAVLYYENIRGSRNPFYWMKAMELVHQKLPNARFHIYNISDKRYADTLKALVLHNKWGVFTRTLNGPVPHEEVPALLNKADIVVSGLYPLYARSIEAFGCGKAFISPGYKEPGYPWTCDMDPESMAEAILACWADFDKINYRRWAEEHHSAAEMARQAVEIYQRFL